jgi:hypothetical protein
VKQAVVWASPSFGNTVVADRDVAPLRGLTVNSYLYFNQRGSSMKVDIENRICIQSYRGAKVIVLQLFGTSVLATYAVLPT